MEDKIISTWIYLDNEEEKSKYPNNSVKANSATPEFQAIYWRCVVVFFKTSLNFHKEGFRHILFTNTSTIPVVNGFDVHKFFDDNNIEVIKVDNKYRLPQGYYSSFRNQFFEFSIIEHLSKKLDNTDKFLMLDSDCIFTESCAVIFNQLNETDRALTYITTKEKNYSINGVNSSDMQLLFNEYGIEMNTIPYYSGGEALCCSGSFLKKVANDFPDLFKSLIQRFKEGEIKFNEEAHVLSFFYYKYGAVIGGLDTYIKRMWTNHNYYRNITKEDEDLLIWHLPNEKGEGFEIMFKDIANDNFHFETKNDFKNYAIKSMLNPGNHKINYFKRFKKEVWVLIRKFKK